jgi:transmembrane E3 ubiquitin-protein ligase
MPHPQENARLVVVIVLLFWLLMNPDAGPGFVATPSLTRARLSRQRSAHAVLNSTRWGDFAPLLVDDPPGTAARYLNLTGFRKDDAFAWEDFGRFKDRCEDWSRHAVGQPDVSQPVWQNVTGIVRGPWVRNEASASRHYSDYNLTEINPAVEWSAWAMDWGRNVTGAEGKMMVRIEDQEEAGTEPELLHQDGLPVDIQAREVSATFTVDDEAGTGSSYDMRLHGVHFPRQGALLLTTTSEKFAGIFGLPHLTSRHEYFESSRALLNRTLDKVLTKKERRSFSDPVNPWASSLDTPGESWNPAPHCEYIAYLQIHPPGKDIIDVEPTLTGPENVAKAIEEVEKELRFPRGAPNQPQPRLQVSAVLYSPDCAFFLSTKGPPTYPVADGQHLQGWKQEFWLHSVSTFLLGLALVVFCQVQLLKGQMREASTPSTLGRISFYTVSVMLVADGVTFTCSATWSLSSAAVMLPSLVVTCASFLSMTIGVTFLAEIYKVQEPQWRRRDRQTTPNNTPRPPTTPANVTNTNPANPAQPTTTPRPSTPIIIPSDQDIDAEIAEVTNNTTANITGGTLPAPVTAGSPLTTTPNGNATFSNILGRYILLGIGLLFLTLAANTWRPPIRSAYFNTLSFCYLSLWVPQIYRNVYRNCRRALSWRFVVGQSVCRLLPIAYFYIVKDNFAFAVSDRPSFAVLAGWVWFQIWILVAQHVLGPRFGLPKGWMPEAWEYHPILREDNMESGGLPIGLGVSSAPASPALERTKSGGGGGGHTRIHSIDCAICREVLEVPMLKAGDDDPTAGGMAGVFARRAYMVTPCRHIFHSACLEGWMRYRLQCPNCREELPPL